MAVDPAVLEDLKAQHTDTELAPYTAGGYDVVLRTPTRQMWRKFRTMGADPSKRGDAVEALFLDAVVYPDKKSVAAMLTKKPALAEVFGDKAVTLAGGAEEAAGNE